MSISPDTLGAQTFNENGYLLCKHFFNTAELKELHAVLLRFHVEWIDSNADFYHTKAVNSAYLTGRKLLSAADRQTLLRFIGSERIAQLLATLTPKPLAFMNTQLFFDPVNADQKNYWHRDIQYTGMSLEKQQQALGNQNVIHLRLALMPEHGLELVPGSHRRWDTEEEINVRLERDGRKKHEDISTAVNVPLQPGDLLVFSANMLHRGLYGLDRLAFDMLFCDVNPELLKFVYKDCLPAGDEFADIENPGVFVRTLQTV